jgi:hypothetical protein
MSIPRGPDRFIDGVPTAYRSFQSDELHGGVSGQVANFVTDAEFHLQAHRDQQPMLIIHHGEHPNQSLEDMAGGLSMFELVTGRPTWLKVFYFNGTELMPVEPGSP